MDFIPTIQYKTLALIAATTLAGWPTLPALANPTTLGAHPLCEGSAATLVACPGDAEKNCLLAADNERSDQLFAFPLTSDGVARDQQAAVALPTSEPVEDIEALVVLPGNRLLVMGSHSRDKRCGNEPDRRHFAIVGLPLQEAPIVKSRKIKGSRLFPDAGAGDTMLQAALAAIDNAEQQAKEVRSRLKAATKDETDKEKVAKSRAAAKKECNDAKPFNAEGAVAVGDDIWVGLRAPLVANAHRNLAILMRLKGQDEWSFDRVILLNLDGHGVRELASDGQYIWVITGPPSDATEDHQLRRFEAAKLDGSAVIAPEVISDKLPPYSEGLVVADGKAYVIVDGDKAKQNGTECQQPTQLFELDLP